MTRLDDRFDLDGLLIFFVVFRGGLEIADGHRLAELGVDVFEGALASLWK